MAARAAMLGVALAWAAPSMGQGVAERLHVEARPGVAWPLHEDLRAFDAGLAVELSAGYRVHRHVGVELSASWLAFETTPVEVAVADQPDAGLGKLVLEERLVPVLLRVRGVLPLGRAELYATLGGGACFSTFSSTLFIAPRSDNAWAWEGGAGVAVRLSEHLSATAGARWLRTEATYHGGTPLLLSGLMTPRLDTLSLGAGLAFRP